MISRFPMQGSSRIFNAQDIDQEIGEFEDPFLKIFYIVMDRGIIEQRGIIVPNKSHAGGAGSYNIIRAGKILYELRADIPGLIPEAGIKSRLAAAGLLRIIGHLHTHLLQHLDHIEGSLGIELIYKTWYE